MEPRSCDYCGAEIEGDGIVHRKRAFCSDECCEAWEDELLNHGEPDAEDLAETDDPLGFDDDVDDDLDGDVDEDGDLDGDLDDEYFDDDDDF
jgi:hypothetical protein